MGSKITLAPGRSTVNLTKLPMSRRSTRVKDKQEKNQEEAKSKAAPFNLEWEDISNYFYVLDTNPKMEGAAKIAAFDMVRSLEDASDTPGSHYRLSEEWRQVSSWQKRLGLVGQYRD
jgi:hypothetical protein